MAKTVSITISANDNFTSVFQNYNNALKDAANGNERIEQTSPKAGKAMDELGKNVQGAIVAYAGFKGIEAIGDLYEQGRKVGIVSQTFSELSKNIGGAATNLQALRDATGGTVSDTDLMTGANKLLQMGLADNTEELSNLSGMAVKLGGSMGMDAKKSFEDFSLMLANNSVMRLDQFGISSGNVRRRMEELKTTMEGIDRNDAFKLAVLEEGKLALERLGTAAFAAETPIGRLETKLQNIADKFAGDFTTGAEGLVGIIEIATGQNPIQIKQEQQRAQASEAATAQATAYAERYKASLIEAFSGSDMNIGEIVGTGGLPDLILQNAFTNMNLGSTATDALQTAFSGLTMNETVGYSDQDLQRIAAVTLQMLQQAEAAKRIADEQAIATEKQQLYQDYLASGGGDDRQASLRSQQEAQDYALMASYGGALGSDLAQTSKAGVQLKPAEITSAMKTDLAAIAKDSATAGNHILRMTENLSKGANYSTIIKGSLEGIQTAYSLTFRFTADDPDGILGVIKAAYGGVGLADVIRSNGGQVPGQSKGKHAGQGGV